MNINYGFRTAIAVGSVSGFTNSLLLIIWGVVAGHHPEGDCDKLDLREGGHEQI